MTFLDTSGHFWSLQTSLGVAEIKDFVYSPKESKYSTKMLSYEPTFFRIGSVVAENDKKRARVPDQSRLGWPQSPGGSREPNKGAGRGRL